MALNINQSKNYLICQPFTNREEKMNMLGIIHDIEHYWRDHKKAVIAVAVIIVVLAIL